MYLTLNAPDLARPLFRAIAPHLPAPLERRWRLPSQRGGSGLPEAVWNDVLALEGEERRQRRLHPLSPVEQDAIRALRGRQWDGLLHLFEQRGISGVMVWNGYRGRRGLLTLAAQHAGLRVVQFERCAYPGFVQAGLGGTNAGAAHLLGEAFASTAPDPEIIDWFAASQRQRPKRGLLGRLSPAQRDTGSTPAALPDRFIYCPLQVAADTQLTVHGGWVEDMPAFIGAVTEAARSLPSDVAVVFRPHPSCAVGQAQALQRAAASSDRVRVIADGSSAALLARSAAVVTVNSSVGLEAFAYDRPVVTLGQSFYGGRGLTHEVQDQTALAAAFKGLGDLSFDADRRRRFLTWLRDEGFQRWPASAADPAARALAQHVAALMDGEG